MVSNLLERLCWAVAFTVVIAFFLPWLKVTEHPVPMDNKRSERAKQELVADASRSWMGSYFGLRSEEIDEALSNPLQGMSGFSLLLLTRSDEPSEQEKARKMIAFLGDVQLREASLLIYAVPALTLIGACFLTAANRGRWIFLIPFGLCLLVYMLMRTRLNETYFDRLVLELPAGIGLWSSLYGLLAVTVMLAVRTVIGLVRK